MAELRHTIGARQAHFGVFDGTVDSGDWELPWTLRESFGEYTLSRELARPGAWIADVPDDLTPMELHDLLAKHERVISYAEQLAEIRRQEAEDEAEGYGHDEAEGHGH